MLVCPCQHWGGCCGTWRMFIILQDPSEITNRNTNSSLLLDSLVFLLSFWHPCCAFVWISLLFVFPIAVKKVCVIEGSGQSLELLWFSSLWKTVFNTGLKSSWSCSRVGRRWEAEFGFHFSKLLLTIPDSFPLLSYTEGLALISHLQSWTLAFYLCNK